MKKLLTVIAAAVTLSSASTFAAGMADKFDGQGYGTAGCGLGSVAFGTEAGAKQILAATTNGSFGTQTFGITFGTSNCGKGLFASRVNEFVDVNRVALETELSRGGGESTVALNQVMNCKNADFSADFRKSYFSQFPQGGASTAQMSSVAMNSCQL